MILHIDHVTVVVRDVAKAKAFFSLLGFVEEKSVVISGPQISHYMGVEGIEAEHVTLVSKQATPRFEIQLLRYIQARACPYEVRFWISTPGSWCFCPDLRDYGGIGRMASLRRRKARAFSTLPVRSGCCTHLCTVGFIEADVREKKENSHDSKSRRRECRKNRHEARDRHHPRLGY